MNRFFLFFILVIYSNCGFSQIKESEFESNIIKIGIVATDIQATLDFYINLIGLTKVREFDIDSSTSYKFGFTNKIPFHVICLKTMDSPQSTELKILSFGNNLTYKKPNTLQDNLGMQYMTIYMKTMTPLINRLNENKIKFLGQTPIKIGEGKLLVLIQDPNGVFIELIGKE